MFEQTSQPRITQAKNITLLQAFLIRSRDSPFHLAISCDVVIDECRLQAVLLPHWPRIHTLTLRIGGVQPPFRPPYPLLTSLKALRYHDASYFEIAEDTNVVDLSSSPFVERLSLSGRQIDATMLISLDPSSVRFLNIEGPMFSHAMRHFIESCRGLTTLRLSTTPTLQPMFSGSLVSLTLIGPVSLASLNIDVVAPSLKHLSVICPLTTKNVILHVAASALSPTYPSLCTLTVNRPNISRVHSLIVNLMKANPSIIALHLGDLNDSSPAKTLEGFAPENPPGSDEPTWLTPGLAVHPIVQALVPSQLSANYLSPRDAPNLVFLRIGLTSNFFRDMAKVVALAEVTLAMLENREGLKVEWCVPDLGDEDPASFAWLESKLPVEVKNLEKRNHLKTRFSINLGSNPPSLEKLFTGGLEDTFDEYELNNTWLGEHWWQDR